MWQKIKHNHFLKHSAVFTLASVGANVLGYLFHAITSRYLGPAKYSDVIATISYSLIFIVPTLAVNIVLVKKIGQRKSLAAKKKLIASIEASLYDFLARHWYFWLLFYLFLSLLGLFNNLSLTTYLLMPLFVIFYIIAQFYVPLLQSAKLFFKLSIIIAAAGIIKLLSAVSSIFTDQLWIILLLLIGSTGVQVVMGHRYTRSLTSGQVKNKFQLSLTKILKNKSLQLTFASILGMMLLNNLDVLFAKKFFTAAEAGMYGIWSLFAKLIVYSAIPLSAVSLVFFADKNTQHQSKKILIISSLLILGLGLGLWGTYLWTGEFIINVLIGVDFAPIIPILPLAAVFGTLYSLIFVLNNYLLAKDSLAALLIPGGIPILYVFMWWLADSIRDLIIIESIGSLAILALLAASSLLNFFPHISEKHT